MKAPLFPATKEGVLKHAEYLYLEEVLAKLKELGLQLQPTEE